MAGTYDTEEQRIIDRIKCIVFREARDAGAPFTNRHWIAEKQQEYVTRRTINNYRHREGLKPFHVIPNPLKSETHIPNRLWLWNWLKDWTEEDFLHFAPSDEFFVWVVRRPNYQNDRIWAKSVGDIEEDKRYREMIKNQAYALEFL
ncbi:unnamed protein product [Rotaria sp. Silwood2]|nr:unnamed protein product [Rotaria sp. Silwood2]